MLVISGIQLLPKSEQVGGSPASSNIQLEWIANLCPEVILLSVAAGDREGMPSPEVLQAVDGYTLLRTDRNAWIKLSTDGQQMWVGVEGE